MDQDRNKAWGFTLFGDDLRVEVGGKLSVMGLYQSDMVFPSSLVLPFGAPKFVALVMYYEIVGAIEGDPTLKMSLGEESNVLGEMTIEKKKATPPPRTKSGEDEENPERIFHARMPFIMAPFLIERLGRLRVRAHYPSGAILKLGSLNIKTIAENDFQKMMGGSDNSEG